MKHLVAPQRDVVRQMNMQFSARIMKNWQDIIPMLIWALDADCISGAVGMEAYPKIINKQGFKNITIHKLKEISIPADILDKFLTKEEISHVQNEETGIFSITVSGYKK
ncbi:MAG: hypothetical protein JXB19_04710 [Bacteroidales bacterium]|nr:hypothetical protein [Bacteroidales bacterium]